MHPVRTLRAPPTRRCFVAARPFFRIAEKRFRCFLLAGLAAREALGWPGDLGRDGLDGHAAGTRPVTFQGATLVPMAQFPPS